MTPKLEGFSSLMYLLLDSIDFHRLQQKVFVKDLTTLKIAQIELFFIDVPHGPNTQIFYILTVALKIVQRKVHIQKYLSCTFVPICTYKYYMMMQ